MRIVLKVSAIFFLLAWAAPGRADTRTWTGAANSNWFDAGNWSPALPGAGDAVIITNAGYPVLLTSSTPDMISLTLSNKTLTVSNGATRILASNVCIQYKGTITVASVYATNGVADYQMSNQVYIVCTNFMLDAGGAINADGKGFEGGAKGQNGFGPGGGGTAGSSGGGGAGGGGHGGQGGAGASGFAGNTNDDDAAPAQPGSGGGGGSTGVGSHAAGAAGGGLVSIAAAGNITINGTVSANGIAAGNGAGGGAGGGINLSCGTFSGSSNGVLCAAGANGGAGAGGGGRIALNYTTLASPVAVRCNVNQGTGSTDPDTSYYHTNGAAKGTIWFPNLDLWNQRITEAGGTLWGMTGYVALATTWTNWETNSLAVTNAWIGFPSNFTLAVNDLTIWNAGAVMLQPGTLVCSNDLTVQGGTLTLQTGNLSCANNLTVTNGGAVWIYSAATNGTGTNYGALASVPGGALSIAANSWVYPVPHPYDGGAPRFRVKDLLISAGGGINANFCGYPGGPKGQDGFGPGGGGTAGSSGGGGAGGGGHGGQGGAGASGFAGNTNDAFSAPAQPGSGGGGGSTGVGSHAAGAAGGGLVSIEAAGDATINGTVSTSGNAAGNGAGGGAGGGIYISCATFGGSATNGLLSAVGGAGSGAGGGGGRIAVWVGVPANMRTRYINSSGADGRAVVWATNWPAFFGTLSVSNGAGGAGAAPGTVFFFKPVKGAQFSAH